MTERRVALWTTAVGLVVTVVGAVLLVPWDAVPGGSLRPAPVSTVLTPEEVARAEEFSRWARTWSWSSLALSLVGDGASVADELRSGWGWTEADLVRAWQDRLLALPGAA